MSIPKETINKIRETADVVEVINDYITLKKKGMNYSACCPFHNEKTPSFSVSPVKGIYKCFGCGKAGDSIQFIMDIEGIGYIEALKHLAKKYSIEVREREVTSEEISQQNEKESLYIILNFAKNYFKELLWNNEEGQAIGYSYYRERGFEKNTIEKFELGYSLNIWDGIANFALEKNYKHELLEKAGLILKKENAEGNPAVYYDRFRGRVIFPIHDVVGKVIGFGARMLGKDKKQPKYINSPETEVYYKSKVLYGLFQSKQSIKSQDNCYLVEGYTDVISLHQQNISNVVASSGTSLTEEQIKLVARYTKNITVLYDGDAAGIKASIRGIDLLLEAGMNVNVVLFPEGEDPDSYVKKIGGNAFKNFLKEAKSDFISFKTKLYLEDANNDPIKRSEVIREIITSISKIPDPIKRQVFLKQCSNMLEIDEQVLISESNKLQIIKSKVNHKNESIEPFILPLELEEPISSINILQLHEREIIRLLLNYGENEIEGNVNVRKYLLQEVEDRDFKNPLYRSMLEIFKTINLQQEDPVSFFIAHEDKEISKEAIDLISTKYELSKNWEKFHIFVTTERTNLGTALYTTVIRLKWRDICEMIEENKENLKNTIDENEVDMHLKIHMKLKEAEREVAGILGNVFR